MRLPTRSTHFPYTTLFRSSKALKQLELGALFHDIGKIGIPTSILLKPGPLTAEERRIMQQHPELGEKIRSEEHTSELQSHVNLVCRLLLEKKNINRHRRSL